MKDLQSRILLLTLAAITFVSLSPEIGLAAQTNESQGVGSYGWQQVYDHTVGGGVRITGSADRKYYDYGYKEVQIAARMEDWWAQDCGWWYVSGTPTIDTFKVYKPDDTVFQSNSSLSAVKGVANITYPWNSSWSSGRWTGQILEGDLVSQFYFYVRGLLSVSSITVVNNTVGELVTVNATITDQTGTIINSTYKDNAGTSTPLMVTMYVSGSGYSYETPMTASANNWTASFTPPRHGDYYITVSATDDHTYWIDGRGRTKVSVTGSFPYAFGDSILKVFLMVLLAVVWLKRSSPEGRVKGRAKVMQYLLALANGGRRVG